MSTLPHPSATEADLRAEIAQLREMVLDLSAAVTTMTARERSLREGVLRVFEASGRPVPASLLEPAPRRPLPLGAHTRHLWALPSPA